VGKIGQASCPIYLLELRSRIQTTRTGSTARAEPRWDVVEEQEKKSLYKIQGTQEIGRQSEEVPVITRNYRQHMAVRSKRCRKSGHLSEKERWDDQGRVCPNDKKS